MTHSKAKPQPIEAGADVASGWLEILAESDADIAAGRIVSSEAVHNGLREAAERLEAGLRGRKATKTR